MLSRISVSTLLKSVIAVLGAAIVVMLALSARDSWARLNAADRISGVANVSGYMFTAMNSLRVDRSATGRSNDDRSHPQHLSRQGNACAE